MMNFLKSLIGFLQFLPSEFWNGIKGLFQLLIDCIKCIFQLIGKLFGGKEEEEERTPLYCAPIPPEASRKPDPCLYSQIYLAAQGISVTWNNPDIHIFDGNGQNMDGLDLDANTNYTVKATIHNASFDPAIGVAVTSFFRAWGVDFDLRTPVETDAANNPLQRIINIPPWGNEVVSFSWKTPDVDQGHYCLTVECFHGDDKEPNNNIGQENTDVRKALPGQTLSIKIPFYNRLANTETFQVHLNEYRIAEKENEYELKEVPSMAALNRREKRDFYAKNQRVNSSKLAAAVAANPKPDQRQIAAAIKEHASIGSRIRLPKNQRARSKKVNYKVYGYAGLDPVIDRNRHGQFPLAEDWELTFANLEKKDEQWLAVIPSKTTTQLDMALKIPADAISGSEKQINLFATTTHGRFVGGVTLIIKIE